MKFNIKNTVVVAAIATMTMPASAAELQTPTYANGKLTLPEAARLLAPSLVP